MLLAPEKETDSLMNFTHLKAVIDLVVVAINKRRISILEKRQIGEKDADKGDERWIKHV